MKKIIFIAAMMISFISAFAMRIEYGRNIIISKPVYEDLYIAGGTITINAPVFGDLIVAGGTVVINDTVMNDILIAGGSVTFNGFAGDDIRCAGGSVHISKNVAGDVVITAGDVVVEREATIGGLLAGSGDMTINGNVAGNIKGSFGKLYLNGNVGGNIDCRGDKISMNGIVSGKSIIAARKIIIGSSAVFNNAVRYWSKQENADFKQSVKNGNAAFDPSLEISTGKWYYLGAVTALGLFWYIGMAFTMILLIQFLFSGTLKRAAGIFYNKPLTSFGLGALFLIAVPVAAVATFITIIGVPLGLLLVFSYIILIILASVITSVVLSNWINNVYNKQWRFWRLAFLALGIFILLKLISLTPFAGWLIMALVCSAAFGSILLNINWKKKNRQQAV